MTETTSPSAPVEGPCDLPWCSTPHGGTLHPDDEDHRSEGVHVSLPGAGAAILEIEFGVWRSRAGGDALFVLDVDGSTALSLPLDAARRLVRALANDPIVGPDATP